MHMYQIKMNTKKHRINFSNLHHFPHCHSRHQMGYHQMDYHQVNLNEKNSCYKEISQN